MSAPTGGESRELPILFTGPMVRAILDGSKTQTRRVVKQNLAGRVERGGRQWHIEDPNAVKACPYGQPGDRLYVRETWNVHKAYDDIAPRDIYLGADDKIGYAASGSMYLMGKHRRSIHMPKRFARLWLRVTDVRVERVQEITPADVVREGCRRDSDGMLGPATFADLWDSINAKRGFGWDENPWVWVVTFERTEKPS